MHRILLSLLLTRAVIYCASAGSVPANPVTILLDFDKPHSQTSLQAMETEVSSLMKATGLAVEWQMKNELGPDTEFAELVVIKLTGYCMTETVPMPMDERGPLAFSYSTDGAVLPFGEVECDRVKTALRRFLAGQDYREGDFLLGRALGRVLVHEMYHMLAHDRKHTKSGLTRESLTADELIADHFSLAAKAVKEMRRNHRDD
jgi:hypothetical protein